MNRLDQVVIASQMRPPALVLVEGEVRRAGYFTIEIGERLSSVLKRSGGFTPNAFPNGIVLVRESVKLKQQAELDRFIAAERQRLTAQSAGIAAGTAGLSVVAAAGGTMAEQQVLALRLQQLEATASRIELGRVIVSLDSIEHLEGTEDDIILESRDRITIPTPPQTVGIIGSVKNPSTVVYRPGLDLNDYLRQAGGITEDANKREMYVMRANGTTDSSYLSAPGVLAARDPRKNRSEERDSVDVDRRCADVVADGIHACVVTLAKRVVVIGRRCCIGEFGRQPDLGERIRDHRRKRLRSGIALVFVLTLVDSLAHRRVQRVEHLVTVGFGGCDRNGHRTPTLIHHLAVVVG